MVPVLGKWIASCRTIASGSRPIGLLWCSIPGNFRLSVIVHLVYMWVLFSTELSQRNASHHRGNEAEILRQSVKQTSTDSYGLLPS